MTKSEKVTILHKNYKETVDMMEKLMADVKSGYIRGMFIAAKTSEDSIVIVGSNVSLPELYEMVGYMQNYAASMTVYESIEIL